MTAPDTCGTSGGAISVCFRVTYCNHLGSIVTTWQNLTSRGSTIYCSVQHVTLVAQKTFIIVLVLLSRKTVLLLLFNDAYLSKGHKTR